jgi:hypothetical protein
MWEDKKAIFIIGSPRSGTTWLLRLLQKHTNLVIATPYSLGYHDDLGEESNFFNYRIKQHKFRTNSAKKNYIRKRYFSILKPHNVGFVDKTPAHSFYSDEILECFPDAYFINILRNGLDVTASIKEYKYFRLKNYAPFGNSRPDNWRDEEEFKKVELDDDELNQWRDHTKASLSLRKLGKQYITMYYDDMVLDPVIALEHLFEDIGLKNEASQIVRMYDENSPSKLGVNPKIKIIGTYSSRWKGVLDERELSFFKENSGDLMNEMGCDWD